MEEIIRMKNTYDYGLIGNCAYLALIKKDTNVSWLCLPRFDSSFVFGSLLDEEKGGEFSIKPSEGEFTTYQKYIPNTNVLITDVECAEGTYRVTDFAPRYYLYDRYFRPTLLIRKLEVLSGMPSIIIRCSPVYNYGKMELHKARGSNHISFLGMNENMRLTTDVPINHIMDERKFVLTGTKYLALTYGEPFEAPLQTTCERFLNETIRYWQRWVKSTSIGLAFQDEVIRSSLCLKIHQFEDTGGIIASPTTSLPEMDKATRNWDYRYCWMRDTFYTLTAFNNIGHFEEMEKYFEYLTNIPMRDIDRIQPLYSVTGEHKLVEIELDLAGYLNNKPVRIGNDAYTHIQNDVYGQIFLAVLPLYVDKRFKANLRMETLDFINKMLDFIEHTIDEPDAGLWEFRNFAQHHTYTYLFQWAGSAGALKTALVLNNKSMAAKAEFLMKRAASVIESTYDEERRVYTQGVGSSNLDASTLQLIMMNYLDPNSQRARDHLSALEKELSAGDGLFYRYRHNDDFGAPENTFLICGFWYVEALACVGRIEEAQKYFKHLCSYSNHVGLLSEDVNARTGGMWGNFPQAYSHVGLVNAAYRIRNKLNRPEFL